MTFYSIDLFVMVLYHIGFQCFNFLSRQFLVLCQSGENAFFFFNVFLSLSIFTFCVSPLLPLALDILHVGQTIKYAVSLLIALFTLSLVHSTI